MSMTDNMIADTSVMLDEQGESLSIGRAALSWSVGMASQSWSMRGTVVGDWQPLTGAMIRAEEARKVKSNAQVIVRPDEDIQEGDRVYRSSGDFMYVNYIRKYTGHWVLFDSRNL